MKRLIVLGARKAVFVRKCVFILCFAAICILPACNDTVPSIPDEDYVCPVPAAEILVETSTAPGAASPRIKGSEKTTLSQPAKAGPLRLDLADAVLTALANNASFRVERLQPSISRTYEQEERSAFDPSLSAELSRIRERKDEDVPHQAVDEATRAPSPPPTSLHLKPEATPAILILQ
jgi:hypothetical protein